MRKLALAFFAVVAATLFAAKIQCPTEPSTWEDWRQLEISGLAGLTEKASPRLSAILGAPGETGYPFKTLEDCLAKAPDGIRACFAPIIRMRRLRTESSATTQWAPPLSNQEYLAKYGDLIDLKHIPSELTSSALLAELDDPKTVSRGLERLRKLQVGKTWKILKYDSVSGENVDRIEVFIPGKDADRFLQISVRNPNYHPPPGEPPDSAYTGNIRAVNLIVAQTEDKGQALEAPQLHYLTANMDSVVTGKKDGFKELRLSLNRLTDPHLRSINKGNCFNCHQGSLLSLHGNRHLAALSDEVRKAIAAFNGHVNGYGVTRDMGREIKMDKQSGLGQFGPVVGLADLPSRTAAFFEDCAPHTKPARRAALRRAMNCVECHDTVNANQNFIYLGNEDRVEIVSNFVVDRHSMPPASHLSAEEVDDLMQCLIVENRDLWEQGLRTTPCQGLGASHSTNEETPASPHSDGPR